MVHPLAKPIPAREILRKRQQALDVFFEPTRVAVIGATETPGSVGRTIVQNLIGSPFGGTVFPVNPKRPSVLGIKSYPSIAAVPEKVDLAVIVTPAPTVPGVIAECTAAGVEGAIIISAGFKETGKAGADLEHDILKKARAGRMRLIGPNCLGVMRPPSGFNATFANGIAAPGSVAFISQSGALCTAILDWSRREQVGFSAFISVGSMLDVGWGDLIDYLGDDPQTKAILIYMESVGDARAFLSAAREVTLTKPVIVIKAGRTELAAKAAASHTGSLAGSDAVLEAAFRRSGVLRVNRVSDLFYMSEVLAKQPRPKGPRLAIVTNAGGPGVLATDALVAEGLELAALSKQTLEDLNKILPAAWSHGNPIDVLGDAPPARFRQTLDVIAKDPGADGMLVVLTPQAMTDPTGTAKELTQSKQPEGKPILASWMGGPDVADGDLLLSRSGVPTFPYPDTAVRAFAYMWRYTYNLKGLYETPALPSETADETKRRAQVDALLQKTRSAQRTLLTESESKSLLAAYGIPTVKTVLAHSPGEAARRAEQIGFPVVLKLNSETITHKSDVGGVKLDLKSAREVRDAYAAIAAAVPKKDFQGVTIQPMITGKGLELIVGSSVDPQFGPVLLFGAGGILVEIFKDRSLALPPLTNVLARRMMEQTKIYAALKGVRGAKSVNLAELEALLVRFSQLVVEHPRIKEIDINPLRASSDGILALDARVLLHDAKLKDDVLPRPAIRPYPIEYQWRVTSRDGQRVLLRPIRPEDEPLVAKLHSTLSEQSVYRRYLQQISLDQRVAHERLIRVCFNDYDRELALVADVRDSKTGEHSLMAIGRLIKMPEVAEGEISVLVGDPYQHQGVGSAIVQRLIEIAKIEKLKLVRADILPENVGMQRICERLGFVLSCDLHASVLHAVLHLEGKPL
jgi:acetyltransferase